MQGGRGQESKRRRFPAFREVSCVRARFHLLLRRSESELRAGRNRGAQRRAQLNGTRRDAARHGAGQVWAWIARTVYLPAACAGWLDSHSSHAGCAAWPRRDPTRDGRAMDGAGSRCKIVVVGDTQCGKTALLHVFAKDCYPEVRQEMGQNS